MFDFLKWALDDFWRFIGFAILLGITLGGIAEIVRAFR
jgi:hypothetical protein